MEKSKKQNKLITPAFWENLAEEGKSEEEINRQLEDLKEGVSQRPAKEIFTPSSNEFSPVFEEELNASLLSILNTVPKADQSRRIKKFTLELQSHLNLVLNQKAFCEIQFDAYPLYQFFHAVSNVFDKAELQILDSHIELNINNSTNTSLIHTIIKNDSFTCFKKGTLSLSLFDFAKLLKCNASDKSTTTLTFTKKQLNIHIYSQKHNATITRTLKPTDDEFEELNREALQLSFIGKFKIPKEKLDYIFSNLGITSDVIDIEVHHDKVVFVEDQNKITAEKKHLPFIELTPAKPEQESTQTTLGLGLLKEFQKLTKPLEKKDLIKFHINDNTHLKTTIHFNKLGNTKLTYIQACRDPVYFEGEDDDEFSEF